MKTMRWIACGAAVCALGAGYGCGSSTGGGEPVGVASSASTYGCLAAVHVACDGELKNHGDCVSCVAHAVQDLAACSGLSGAEEAKIIVLFAHREEACACVPTSCAAQGATCGTMADGCGSTMDCGTCPNGQACGSNYACVCTPSTCSELGATCGTISDGCGNPLECGSCSTPWLCLNNTCVWGGPT
jgi:hypothetical protein